MAKVDRFVEQRAGDRPGYLLTREFVLEGNRLTLNTAMPQKPYHEQFMRVEIARHPPLGAHYGSSQPYPASAWTIRTRCAAPGPRSNSARAYGVWRTASISRPAPPPRNTSNNATTSSSRSL